MTDSSQAAADSTGATTTRREVQEIPAFERMTMAPAIMRCPGRSTSPQAVLFTDTGHILCSDLEWLSPGGEVIPLIDPPRPKVDALAGNHHVPYGVRLVAQQPTKGEPLPYNAPGGRVLFEEGLYRSWFPKVEYPPGRNFGSYSQDKPISTAICYTESRDGYEWSEPVASPIELSGTTGMDGATFFIDPHGPENERYKLVYMAPAPPEQQAALWQEYSKLHWRHRDWRLREGHLTAIYGAVSPDGQQWKMLPEPLMVHKSDTDTSVHYDEWLGKYVMFTRLYRHDRRWIGRAESDDFYHWSPVEPLLWPTLDDHFADDLYTNGWTTYPGLPEYQLMFPMLYHRYDQTSEVHLCSSADGICWNRVTGGPILKPGEPGEWDSEFIHVRSDLVPLGREHIGVRQHGTSYPHKYPRWEGVVEAGRSAWVTWPKGRLVAVKADEEGAFCTMPLVPAGRGLKINVRTRRGGWVRVGIVRCLGRSAADCDPICVDSTAHPVSWSGHADISVPVGEPIILQFQLRAAEVFGFEW